MKMISVISSKFIIFVIFAVSFAACTNSSVAPATSTQNNQNQTVQSNTNAGNPTATATEDKRTAMHKRLDALVGEWNVEKSNYFVLGGTAENPVVSRDLICRREWIKEVGNMYIKDVTEGTFVGSPYYRLGILGYSPTDNRYEWNTIDNFAPMMMTYKGATGSAKPDGEISIGGEFTDSGVLGKENAGKTIAQRTVIKIESPDRNVMEIYFTPPGKPEFLADRAVYTRRK